MGSALGTVSCNVSSHEKDGILITSLKSGDNSDADKKKYSSLLGQTSKFSNTRPGRSKLKVRTDSKKCKKSGKTHRKLHYECA